MKNILILLSVLIIVFSALALSGCEKKSKNRIDVDVTTQTNAATTLRGNDNVGDDEFSARY